jgi:5-methylcytosine-specific restriction endonuclease McrA
MASNTRSLPSKTRSALEPTISIDTAEQTLVTAELHIARLRAIQMDALEVIDQAQVASGDGARSLSEWVAARADVSLDTAKSLVRTMRRTSERPTLRALGHEAESSFDRIEAASKILPLGDPDPIFRHLDIAGVVRESARRARITASKETRTSDDQYLVLQPSLDLSWWNVWGGMDGATGAIVDEALSRAADSLPTDDPNMPADGAWRRATALALICTSDLALPTQVTVFVDAETAANSAAEAGVYLEAGPRVGRRALESLLCDSTTELVAISEQGEPMRYGRRSRTIPPSLRRAIIHRDGNRCSIDGCDSRNRIQVHHIVPWSEGGATDPENLLTVCWYHHHIAIHQHDLIPQRHPSHGRWRLRPAERPPPD